VTAPLRVLIADDHPPTRAGVRMALEESGCEVCAEVANAGDAVTAALREHPDVCVLDIDMPGNGLSAVAGITTHLPGTPIVMLTVSGRTEDLLDALRAGASGYLLKDMDPSGLAPALAAVAAGEAAIPGDLTARLVERFRYGDTGRTARSADGEAVELTPRESEVRDLLAEGQSTSQMAHRLFLSEVTVRRHMSSLMHKLGVSSRAELVWLLRRRNGD
jgi:DNA-binding NarL/FixJ family response regulator